VCAEFLRGPFFSKFSSTTEPCGYRSLYAKEPYEYEINAALLWKEPYVYETNMAFFWKDPILEGDLFFFQNSLSTDEPDEYRTLTTKDI